MINAFWLVAIGAAAFAGVAGAGPEPLLAIIAVLLMEGVLELKVIRQHGETVAQVFEVEPDPLTDAQADEMTEAITARLRDDMRARSARRAN